MEIVGIYNDSESLNRSIARLVAGGIERLVAARGVAVVLFDSDPELADSYALLGEMELPWTRVVGFQLAEWCGVDEDDPRAGRRRLLDDLVRRVAMAEFHSLRGDAANLPAVCTNYGELLYARCSVLAPLAPLAVVREVGQAPPLPVQFGSPVANAGGQATFEVVCGGESIGLTQRALLAFDRIIVRGDIRMGRSQVWRVERGEDREVFSLAGPSHDTLNQ